LLDLSVFSTPFLPAFYGFNTGERSEAPERTQPTVDRPGEVQIPTALLFVGLTATRKRGIGLVESLVRRWFSEAVLNTQRWTVTDERALER
jgi:hypothetical protein